MATETNTKRGKVNGYNFSKQQARRDKRTLEAENRQAVYDKLTLQQRIDLAKSRRGKSKQEIARLTKKIEKTSAKS